MKGKRKFYLNQVAIKVNVIGSSKRIKCNKLCDNISIIYQDNLNLANKKSNSEEQCQGAMSKLNSLNVIRLMNRRRTLILISLLALKLIIQIKDCQATSSSLTTAQIGGYQPIISGEVNGQARLPCLIGLPFNCGRPYFIVWYKLNAATKGNWAGVLRKSFDEISLASGDTEREQSSDDTTINDEHFRFHWNRQLRNRNSNDIHQDSLCSQVTQTFSARSNAANQFDCAELVIDKVKLEDEGQYKCEVTFTDSLDIDKCPPNTLSQLTVIARPNEPELFLNGRLLASSMLNTEDTNNNNNNNNNEPSDIQRNRALTFKENTQIRLECQSSGGRPSPRIEWLNVSKNFNFNSNREIQLMRNQKKSSLPIVSIKDNHNQLVSSSMVTLSLTRYDLNSHFVCLMIPQTIQFNSMEGPTQQQNNLDQMLRSPADLGALLGRSNRASIRPDQLVDIDQQQQQQPQEPMSKWIKFDVQVKPSSASLIVRDLRTNTPLNVSHWQWSGQAASQLPASGYKLQLNQLYAIQCIIENSRPISRFSWFNRSSQIELDSIELNDTDFLMPDTFSLHRLSSFVRHQQNSDGTFRTISSLLITSNIWDNYEEISCRVSNEVFQFEELTSQVAPIMSAGLWINYGPTIWLEAENASKWTTTNGGERESGNTNESGSGELKVDEGTELSLRCWVAANPLLQSMILHVDWLRDGLRLDQNSKLARVNIERSTHLHSPSNVKGESSFLASSSQLVGQSKLLASSRLTFSPISRLDAAKYSCQFKLTPASIPALSSNGQIGPKASLSGQPERAIQVHVIEAKPKAPILRIQSASRGLILYTNRLNHSSNYVGLASTTLQQQQQHQYGGEQQQQQNGKLLQYQTQTLVAEPSDLLSLKCDLNLPNFLRREQQHHKIIWLLNGNHLYSSQNSDTFNFSINSLELESSKLKNMSLLSCVHQIISSPNTSTVITSANRKADSFHANQIRLSPSINSFELKPKVEPTFLTDKREWMPPIRSFSKFELEANPSQRLRLACLARCEPICSIRWLVNGIYMDSFVDRGSHMEQNEPTAEFMIDKEYIGSRRLNELDKLAQLDISSSGPLSLSETIYRRLSNESSAISSWISETSIGPKQTIQMRSQLGALKAEFDPLGQLGANVFAKFELPYTHLGRILSSEKNDHLSVKCQLEEPQITSNKNRHYHINKILDTVKTTRSPFKASFISPLEWYPSSSVIDFEKGTTSFPDYEVSDLSLNTLLINNENKNNFNNNKQHNSRSPELETIITLDKPPRSVMVAFRGIISSDTNPLGLSITENQLPELSDPNNRESFVQCRVGGSVYPPVNYRWTFTDLNGNEQVLPIDKDQFDLRQFIEFRQRQLNVDPTNAYGIDVVASIAGNYTCTANNIHGSRGATLPLMIEGAPLCKLSFDSTGEGLNTALKCQIYSYPSSIETIWLQGTKQIALNQSIGLDGIVSIERALSYKILPLDNQKLPFLSPSDIKCLARNSLGSSSACELSLSEIQKLKTFSKKYDNSKDLRPFPWSLKDGTKQTSLNVSSDLGQLHDQINGLSGWLVNVLTRPDIIISAALCSLFAYLLISLSIGFIKRRKLRLSGLDNKDTSWHFNSNGSKLTRSCHRDLMGSTFQSKMGMSSTNYYGGSNGDSEHDMMQSCSQSSQYEEFGSAGLSQNQRQMQLIQSQQQQQHQPLYLNNQAHAMNHTSSTISRRPIKSSRSISSNGDSGGSGTLGSRRNNTKLVRLNDRSRFGQMNTMRDFSSSTFQQQQQQHYPSGTNVCSTKYIKDSPIEGTSSGTSEIGHRNEDELNLISNQMPLINSSQASQINLDSHKATTNRISHRDETRDGGKLFESVFQQPQSKRSEHIYDDIIYQQMIL